MIARMFGVAFLMIACFLFGNDGIAQEAKTYRQCLIDCEYNHGGCVAVAKRFTPVEKRALDITLCDRFYRSCRTKLCRKR